MKVLLLDRNEAYAARFAQYVGKKSDMQISLCNDLEVCKQMLAREHFHVVLFDAEFDAEKPADYSRKMTAFAFISAVKDKIGETDTIYKYSSVSEICAEIMRVYAEHTQHEMKQEDTEEGSVSTEVITFLPVSGGSGSSTMAAAASAALSEKGKVLYLNLEQRSAESLLFTSDCQKCITDIVAALQTNFQLKEAKRLFDTAIGAETHFGTSGNLDFIRGWLNIEDCVSLTPPILTTVLNVLRKQYQYRYIIIDADFIIGDVLRTMIQLSDKVVFVSTGTDVANMKTEDIHRYLEIVARESDGEMPKKYLLLNQYYGMNDEHSVARDMEIIGRFARYRAEDHSLLSTAGIAAQILAKQGAFDDLA